MIDRATGPISREEFQEIAAAPFGEAKKRIRQYDPFWGLQDGEKIPFLVELTGHMRGEAVVMAANQKEADKLAGELTDAEIDWMDGGEGFDVLSVEPRKTR